MAPVKVPALLLAGALAGAALRLLWLGSPSSVAGVAGAGSPARAGQKATGKSAATHTGTALRTDAEAGARERVKKKLRQLGLVPRDDSAAPAPSWLYVGAPEGVLLKSEEYVEASIGATEATVDEQCGPLFAQLGLAPERADRLRRTLAEMVFARHEIAVLADADGRRSRDKPLGRVQEMVAASDEEHRRRIQEQLGGQDFARFEAYFETLQERFDLRNGFMRVAMLAEPLTPTQRDTLVAARHAAKNGRPAPVDISALLTPAQHAVFAEWQVDELAQRKLAELVYRRPQGVRVVPLYGGTWRPDPTAP